MHLVLIRFYTPHSILLAQNYTHYPELLHDIQRERLIFDASYKEHIFLETNLPSNDLFILQINKRLMEDLSVSKIFR